MSYTALKWVVVLSVLFGELLLHTWIRTGATQVTLEISLAQSQLSDLLSYQKELTLERDRLKSDNRIIGIARTHLGLTEEVFNQTLFLEKEDD
ncbi:MAG: cell division protein FtsL [Desulfotignum sp.]|jgi:hypothetical protein|nr:cell division protein FtsL [Desulfotignum sp.]